MIKLIALDIDGTLLGKNKRVSKKNIAAINEARKKGIKFCIASGRAFNRVDKIAKEIGINESLEYVVTMNGGAIYKYDKNKKPVLIKETLFDIDDVKYIYNSALDNKLNCFSYSQDIKVAYVIKNKGAFIWFMKKISHRKIKVYTKDEMDQKAYKIIVYGKKKLIEKCKETLSQKNYEMFSWSYVSGNTANIEINPNGVDKIFALQDIAKVENITADEIMYFGDGDNDKKAMEWVGLSVAMKNASKHIKKIATQITGHHKKSGVAKALNEYLKSIESEK
ncbi:Cof-type HAD-IIB family hydrolase [Spiroplasma tabanidicola]|uniref:HAD superfamily hydrolase n=1 Tax=Spiroplasma tabanidicola TaxID=324079 RepID=A0A6I6C9K7_9MOLU|nr:HAD family hydrolase [Spiroplasma tabanidicola]QGS51581.1 HAD superfamily hydrolase [Spiroplasma tabanidicola]